MAPYKTILKDVQIHSSLIMLQIGKNYDSDRTLEHTNIASFWLCAILVYDPNLLLIIRMQS